MYVNEFLVGFHSRSGKICKHELNEKLNGHLLLQQANFDVHDLDIAVGSVGKTTLSRP